MFLYKFSVLYWNYNSSWGTCAADKAEWIYSDTNTLSVFINIIIILISAATGITAHSL